MFPSGTSVSRLNRPRTHFRAGGIILAGLVVLGFAIVVVRGTQDSGPMDGTHSDVRKAGTNTPPPADPQADRLLTLRPITRDSVLLSLASQLVERQQSMQALLRETNAELGITKEAARASLNRAIAHLLVLTNDAAAISDMAEFVARVSRPLRAPLQKSRPPNGVLDELLGLGRQVRLKAATLQRLTCAYAIQKNFTGLPGADPTVKAAVVELCTGPVISTESAAALHSNPHASNEQRAVIESIVDALTRDAE